MDLDDLAQKASALLRDAAALLREVVAQPLSQFFLSLKQDERTVLYVLLAMAIAVGIVIGRTSGSRNRFRKFRTLRTSEFQNRSEQLLAHVAKANFAPPDYHLMNHVTIQMKDGTTQVDHILVSRFGVFVIETKDYRGWIFADAEQKSWTQVLFRLKFKFQNPIHQNFRHVRAVQALLDFLPPGAIKSVVVFTGDAEFKTEIPQGVFNIPGMVDYLRAQTEEVMPINRMQFCVGRLETARLAISGQTDIEHVQSLERRHGATTVNHRVGRWLG